MKSNEKLKNKKNLWPIITLVIGIFMGNLISPLCSDDTHKDIVEKFENQEQVLIEKNEEIEILNAKVDSAKPWFEKTEAEQKAIEEEIERKKAEEEEAKLLAKQEEERKGYDTNIFYDDLARTPKNYVGKKVKFQGKVVQVLENDEEVQLRLAVDGDYDTIIYCVYDSSLVSSRILENDQIIVMGLSTDLITYESTMGGKITIPSMLVQRIDVCS